MIDTLFPHNVRTGDILTNRLDGIDRRVVTVHGADDYGVIRATTVAVRQTGAVFLADPETALWEDTPVTDPGDSMVWVIRPEATDDTAPVTCATCGQTLTEWTNRNGVTLLIADDGWGSICGGAPRGMHQPTDAAPRTGAIVDPFGAPDAPPSPPLH